MKILFFGGTKFFGKLIVEALVKEGHEVCSVSRVSPSANYPAPVMQWTKGLWKWILGDRNDPKVLELAQREGPFDVIIDNIAYNAEDVRTALGIPCKQYILTSSIAVNYPDATKSDYARKKRDTEDELLESSNWTIFRPGIVYGPYDPVGKHLWYIKRILKNEVLCSDFRAFQRIDMVFSEDIPAAFVRALLNPRYFSRIFDLIGDRLPLSEYLSMHSDFLKIPINWSVEFKEDCGPFAYYQDFIGLNKAPPGWDWTPWEEMIPKTIPWFKEQLELSIATSQDQLVP